MKIYKMRADVDRFENLQPCFEADADFYQQFDGKRLKDTWERKEVRRMEPEKNLELGDYPGFCLPVFNRKALDVLLPLIENDVEILPFKFENSELYGVNVITVLEAINYEKSDYLRFSDKGRIMRFKKYAFKKDVIGEKLIFKIVDEPRRSPFITESFYNVVNDNHLKGFRFELVDEI